jgi:hypothetical protein
MATPLGTNTVTSIARRWIMPTITDNVYNSNPVFFRLNAANKKVIRGGTQLEVPLMYARFAAGGPYSGYDKLNTTPSDTVKNAAFDWRQHHVPVTVDGLTLIKTDSPDAIANFLDQYFAQAEMEMVENLAVGLWSDGTNPKDIDGLEAAVDDATVAATYGGLLRSANPFWNAQHDSSTATLTMAALNSMHGACSNGGRHPTLICSRQMQYNRFWNLNVAQQRYPSGPGAVDEQLAQAGFTNLLFNGVPWVVDSHVFDGPNASNSAIVFLTESYMWLAVSPRADFYLEDFQVPTDQDAMTAKMLWAGNLLMSNVQRQGKMTAVTA